jgi:uncharacterized membrane protein
MAETTVRVSLPADGRILTIDLDDTVTVKELTDELVTSGQILSSPGGYRLNKTTGEPLAGDRKIRDLGLTDSDVLSVAPAPLAADSRPSAGPAAPAKASQPNLVLPIIGILLLLAGVARFAYEEQNYQAARGNIDGLNAYLQNCIMCVRKSEAQQETNSLRSSIASGEQPQTGGQERNERPAAQSVPEAPSYPPQQVSQFFQLQACNTGCAPASVAMSYYSQQDGSWVTRGWWTVRGNQCTSLGSFNKGAFYYYAMYYFTHADVAAGGFNLCVNVRSEFSYANKGGQCPRGGEARRFVSLNIQSDQYTLPIQTFCE